jgi:hypothetical protein
VIRRLRQRTRRPRQGTCGLRQFRWPNGTHINTVVSKAGDVVSGTGTKVDHVKDDRD